MWWFFFTVALAWDERGMGGSPTGRIIEPDAHFVPSLPSWHATSVNTSPLDLGLVAGHTADTLRRLRREGGALADPALFGELGVTLDDVLATLDLVARVALEDRGESYQRLTDPVWIRSHFTALEWIPDREGAEARNITLDGPEIRLTKYVVYAVAGSAVRTETHDTALYASPQESIRDRLTRMDVYAGAFDEGGEAEGAAKPLVWLTRDGSNQALLQGTISVTLPGQIERLYNVHLNNGRAWDPLERDLDQQPRYWYFREVDDVFGVEQTPLQPRVTVAGDIYNLGLGKLIALQWPTPQGPEVRLVILSDTGGAFQPNLFQLDYLAGVFPSKAAYAEWSATAPPRVPASILVRRP